MAGNLSANSIEPTPKSPTLERLTPFLESNITSLTASLSESSILPPLFSHDPVAPYDGTPDGLVCAQSWDSYFNNPAAPTYIKTILTTETGSWLSRVENPAIMTTLCPNDLPRELQEPSSSIKYLFTRTYRKRTWITQSLRNKIGPKPICSINPADCAILTRIYNDRVLQGALPDYHVMAISCSVSTDLESISSRCRSEATMTASEAQLYYWPVTLAGNYCDEHRSTISETPTGDGPNTAVVEGFGTITSPTVLISMRALRAELPPNSEADPPICGTVRDVALAMAPESVYTQTEFIVMMDKIQNGTTVRPDCTAGSTRINYADITTPVPASVYTKYICGASYIPFNYTHGPVLAIPERVRDLEEDWKSAVVDFARVWDPPLAFTGVASLAKPTLHIPPSSGGNVVPGATVGPPLAKITEMPVVNQNDPQAQNFVPASNAQQPPPMLTTIANNVLFPGLPSHEGEISEPDFVPDGRKFTIGGMIYQVRPIAKMAGSAVNSADGVGHEEGNSPLRTSMGGDVAPVTRKIGTTGTAISGSDIVVLDKSGSPVATLKSGQSAQTIDGGTVSLGEDGLIVNQNASVNSEDSASATSILGDLILGKNELKTQESPKKGEASNRGGKRGLLGIGYILTVWMGLDMLF
jgi:hypothetical protein